MHLTGHIHQERQIGDKGFPLCSHLLLADPDSAKDFEFYIRLRTSRWIGSMVIRAIT